MPTRDLFGIDIGAVVAAGMASAGNLRSCTLKKISPGTRATDLTAGTNTTMVEYVCQGFVETREIRRPGSLVTESLAVLTLLGASISGGTITPQVNDVVAIDGDDYQLTRLLSADPAGAVYEFVAEAA